MKKLLRVMLIEDSDDDTELVLAELKRGGFDVSHQRIETGVAMYQALGKENWDIIISDFQLPNFNGFDALGIYRLSGFDMPFILVSGTIGEERAVKAMKLGAHDYIMKDNLGRLVPAVERELKDAALRKKHKQAQEVMRRQFSTITALFESSRTLTENLDETELAKGISKAGVETLGADLVWIARAEPDGRLCIAEAYGTASDELKTLNLRWDLQERSKSFCIMALVSSKPVSKHLKNNIDCPMGCCRIIYEKGIHSLSIYPLMVRNKSFGLLCVASTRKVFFDQNYTGFFQSCANHAAAAMENARLFKETENRLIKIKALHDIDKAITGSIDMQLTLDIALEQITGRLKADAAAMLTLNPFAQTLQYTAVKGFMDTGIMKTMIPADDGLSGMTARLKQSFMIHDFDQPGPDIPEHLLNHLRPLALREGFLSCFCVPAITKGQVRGILTIYNKKTFTPDDWWMDFVQAVAGQIAIALDNYSLFEDIQHANYELKSAYEKTIEGWSKALDLRDKETEGHSLRVTEMTVTLARELGLGEDRILQARRGALLHDIGKMGIPDAILLKPGPLTDEEWVIMRKHPVYAYEMLSPIEFLDSALDIPYGHHEKWDGTGYPRGLKQEQIPIAARIFAVADVWDALCSDRPYRKGWPVEKVREHIIGLSGSHFDPKIVEAFVRFCF